MTNAAYIAASFDGTGAAVKIERFDDASPVIYISNNDSMTQDALVLGHIDVVKAADGMFAPKIEDGRMYGRGTLDMKSFAAVAMNSMHYVCWSISRRLSSALFYLPTKNKAAKARVYGALSGAERRRSA